MKRSNTTRKPMTPTWLDGVVNIPTVPEDVIPFERDGKTTEDLLDEAIQVSIIGSVMKKTKYTSPSSLFRRSSLETAISTVLSSTVLSSTDPDDAVALNLDREENPEEENTCTKVEPVLALKTVNQNDFMIQCMIDTSSPCLIHFYVEGSVISEMLDRDLGKLHAQCAETGSRCRFMRLEANSAPFITGKLQVSTQDPSIICIHNGQIFERVVDVDSLVQSPGKVREWASGTGLLSL
jgi:hypothetical protein